MDTRASVDKEKLAQPPVAAGAASVRRAPAFCLDLLNHYQDRISSHLLWKKQALAAGPLNADEPDPVAAALSSSDSVFLGPNAFMCFLLMWELESHPDAPALTANTVCQLLNRHQSAGAQSVKRLLRMAVAQGLLLQQSGEQSPRELVYGCSPELRQVLQDCERAAQAITGADPQTAKHASDPLGEPAADVDDLQRHIKRVYLAHKNGQTDYVLEASAMALKSLRSRYAHCEQRVVDQKVLLLNLRARALLQRGQLSAAEACLSAATKCVAISATRYRLAS